MTFFAAVALSCANAGSHVGFPDVGSYVPDGEACLVPPGANGVVTAAQITTALVILGDTTNLQDHA
jgi:hypothetical protein